MHRLDEVIRVEAIDGMDTPVKHYINTYTKTFDNEKAILISTTNDEELLRRLVGYLFRVSYDATEANGWHMPQRIGGNHAARYKGEIFADKFLGCMGELALYKYIRDKIDDEIETPNLDDARGLGNPDIRDLSWNNRHFSIKTTRDTHNLLLLQRQHYLDNGDYGPNVERRVLPRCFDYHVLCRLRQTGADTGQDWDRQLRKRQNEITTEERNYLTNVIMEGNWLVDIPGFISNEAFVSEVIRDNYLVYGDTDVEKRCFGNSPYTPTTRVDVDNYYVQSGDLVNIGRIKEITRIQGTVRYSNPIDHYAYLTDDNNNEYTVSNYTYDHTAENERLLGYANRARLSFTVVRKNHRLYANDIQEVLQ